MIDFLTPFMYFNFCLSSETPTLLFSLEKVTKKVLHSSGFFPYRPLMESNSRDCSMARQCMMFNSNNGERYWIQVAVEPRFTDTHRIRAPCYYGQFSLYLALTFSLNSTRLIIKVDTLLIRTLSKVRINGICLYPGVTLNQYNQTPLISWHWGDLRKCPY